MLDLFNFLKAFLQNEVETIAAFFMGIIVAVIFLSSLIYWGVGKLYAKKIRALEAEIAKLSNAKVQRDDFEKQLELATGRRQRDKKQLQLKDRETNDLQMKAAGLQERLAASQAKHEELAIRTKKESESVQQMITSLNAQISSVSEKLSAALKQAADYRQKFSAASSEAADYRQKFSSASNDLAEYRQKLTAASNETAEYKQKFSAAFNEAANYQQKLTAASNDTAEYKQKFSSASNEAASYQQKLSAALDETAEYKQKLSAASKEVADYQQKLSTASAKAAKKLEELNDTITSLAADCKSLNDQSEQIAVLQGRFWEAPVSRSSENLPVFRPLAKHKAAIIAVTNLKGGVGKTTLTANLAVTYSLMGQRVLAVDLDHQASLTGKCLTPDQVHDLRFGDGKFIENVFMAQSNFGRVASNNINHLNAQGLFLLAASEEFFNVEEHTKARWLMNLSGVDCRCLLRSALHSPEIQDRFDIIFLDCPPRWTTASINAMTCSDYLLIPTQLEEISTEAVPRLLAWLRNLKTQVNEIYSQIKILGVVANLTFPNTPQLTRTERAIWEALPRRCERAWNGPIYHFQEYIKKFSTTHALAAVDRNLGPKFIKLVEEIESRRKDL
jgi:cellulose biosynthesis protein BcsQ/predicted  nucleic acid-binding Zn-ribbon protein